MHFTLQSLTIIFVVFAHVVLLLPVRGHAQRQDAEKQAQNILSLSSPADCRSIEREASKFLETWPDHRASQTIRLKRLECETDWDLVREQLGRLGRQDRDEETALKASERLIELLFLNGEYDTVISESERFLAKYTEKGPHEQILFFQASSLFNLQQYDRARQTFLVLILRYPKSELVGRAQFGLADTYFQQRDPAEALEQFNMARRKTRDVHLLAEIELRVARCYQALDDRSRAIQALRKVQDMVPNSPQAIEAASLLAELQSRTSPSVDKSANRDTNKPKPTPVNPIRQNEPGKTAQPDLSPAASSGYTLQVGAFAHKDNAFDLLDALKLKGYDAYVLFNERAERIIYKIRVGQCISKQDAMQISQRLLKEENMNSYLTSCESR